VSGFAPVAPRWFLAASAVTAEHVDVDTCCADVVIADNDVEGNVANEGRAAFVGVDVVIPNGEPKVAIAAFGAIGVDVVAGVQSKVGLWEFRRAGTERLCTLYMRWMMRAS
jgi:hypothetical protein